MGHLPNWTLFKECQECNNKMFGQYDKYCSRCGAELKNCDEWLASISDYAKTLLIDFLQTQVELCFEIGIEEIPSYATEGINANGNIVFDQGATRHIVAVNWNEVEIAIDDWRERTGFNYQWSNIENLHVFCVTQLAETVWREISKDWNGKHLSRKRIKAAIEELKR
ncbi:MAG: hypothetical protein LBT24_05275 [Tannerella sp.]|jgi:hypothetical protein|nr:hypothetical protein [Tannerella sp.]